MSNTMFMMYDDHLFRYKGQFTQHETLNEGNIKSLYYEGITHQSSFPCILYMYTYYTSQNSLSNPHISSPLSYVPLMTTMTLS